MNVGLSILFVLIGAMLALAWASPRLYEGHLREHRTCPAPGRRERHSSVRMSLAARQRRNREARRAYRSSRRPKSAPRHAKKRLRARKRGD